VFEDPRLAGFDLGDFNGLHELALLKGAKAFFFDEIQNIDNWEGFVTVYFRDQKRVSGRFDRAHKSNASTVY